MTREQERVDRYFDQASTYWRGVYASGDVQGLVYRLRMSTAEAWLRQLELGPEARALEVGCGAGLMTIAMAQAGLHVTATDSSPAMVDQCRRRAEEAGLASDQVHVRRADAQALPFEDAEYDLVVAIGLLPWLPDAAGAVRELTRVVRPGGYLLVTADNRQRLGRLFEPRENPLLGPLRAARRSVRAQPSRPSSVPSFRHSPQEVDAMLHAAGARPVRRTTVGYGPFTFFGRRLLPDPVGRHLHERLVAASKRHRRIRGAGWHYVVLARRDGSAD